jgi:uncharacterized membrane protein YqjE
MSIPGGSQPLSPLKALGRAVLDVVRTRAELLSVEAAQIQGQVLHLVILAVLAVVTVGLGLQLAALLTVAWFWDTPYRLAAVMGATGLFAAAGIACAIALVLRLRSTPAPFSSSLDALRDDLAPG